MAKISINGYLASLTIRDMQIKATVRNHFTPSKVTRVKKGRCCGALYYTANGDVHITYWGAASSPCSSTSDYSCC